MGKKKIYEMYLKTKEMLECSLLCSDVLGYVITMEHMDDECDRFIDTIRNLWILDIVNDDNMDYASKLHDELMDLKYEFIRKM